MSKNLKLITIIAVRHGESRHNVLTIVNGDPKKQFHLTPKGKKQAQSLVKKLSSKNIDVIFASQMLRTQETARPLAKIKKIKIKIDKRLNDIHAGKLEGINIWEFRKITHNGDNSVQGSENIISLAKRIKSFLNDITKKYPGKVVMVVSSEIILHLLRQIAAGKKPDDSKGRLLKNAMVYSFKID